MNNVAQESSVVIILTMFTGLITFILAVTVVFLAVYTLLHTGQSILGEISVASMGWPHP